MSTLATPKKNVSQRLHPVLGSPLRWLGLFKDAPTLRKPMISPLVNNAMIVNGRLYPKPQTPKATEDDVVCSGGSPSRPAATRLGPSGPSLPNIPGTYPLSNASFLEIEKRIEKNAEKIQERRLKQLARERPRSRPDPSSTFKPAKPVTPPKPLDELIATGDDFEEVLTEYYEFEEDPDIPPPSPSELISIREIERLGKRVAFHETLDEEREAAQKFIPATEHDKIVQERTRQRLLREKEEEERRLLKEKAEKKNEEWFAAQGAPGFPMCPRGPSRPADEEASGHRPSHSVDGESESSRMSRDRASPYHGRIRGRIVSNPFTSPPRDRTSRSLFDKPAARPTVSPLRRERTEIKLQREKAAFAALRAAAARDKREAEARRIREAREAREAAEADAAKHSREGPPPLADLPNLKRILSPAARFAECDAKWALLSTGTNTNIRFTELPWPVLEDIAAHTELTKPKVKKFLMHIRRGLKFVDRDTKFRVRSELMKWHPDKFAPMYMERIHEDDRDEVLAAVNHLTKLLIELVAEA